MTEEEKKAIEDLKDFKSITILYGNTFVMFLEQLIKYQESTNIVLNLITKLEKENEKERNKNKQLSNSIIKIYKEQDNLQARLDRKRDEIREKDKQIDLMAEYISNLDIDENICKEQSDNNCDDINREADCKDCVKQYFEKQAKEKGE